MFQFLIIAALCLVDPTTKVNDGIVEMSDIVFGTSAENSTLHQNLLMDVAFPASADTNLPAVIFIHGGGWAKGKRQDGQRVMNILAKGGYFVATIDYRLTAEGGGFPNAVQDCNAAIKFLKSNSQSLGIDNTKIGLVGHSAGGHLAMLCALGSGTAILDGVINGVDESTKVTCVATISGAVMPEKSERKGSQFNEWATQHGHASAQSYPSTYIDSADPPVYLLCGGRDTICPSSNSKEFSKKLAKAGVDSEIEIVPRQGHAITKPEAYVGILDFLDEHLGGNSKVKLEQFINEKSASGR